jgi:hypothetical protein
LSEGEAEGFLDGPFVGEAGILIGVLSEEEADGTSLGTSDGNSLGNSDGNSLGNSDGNSDGNSLGNSDGNSLGNSLRESLGDSLGDSVPPTFSGVDNCPMGSDTHIKAQYVDHIPIGNV